MFAFVRSLGNQRALVLLNFVDKDVEFELAAGHDWSGYKLRLGNYGDRVGSELRAAVLRGYEGKVYVAQ